MTDLDELMAWIEERSIREEGDDGCLLWQLTLSDGRPYAGRQVNGRKFNVNVRRVLWEAKTGKKVPASWAVVCSCGCERCVEPEHLKAIPRKLLTKGRPLTVTHRIAIAKGRRASGKAIKLTLEAVQDIRYGEGSLREKARRHGICLSHAREVRNQQWWRDLDNPFTALIAANDSRRKVA